MKHVKENDLAHGEFGKWLDSIGVNDRMARKFITIHKELSSKRTMSSELGLEALYQIATLPPEERTKPHETTSGEQKTPDEMTVRELRELKRQLKAEQAARQQVNSSTLFSNLPYSCIVNTRRINEYMW